MDNLYPIDNKPKAVIITAFTLEFHEEDGWSYDLLKSYVNSGGFIRKSNTYLSRDVYYIPEMFSNIDYARMIIDKHMGKLIGKEAFGELHNMSDLDILKKRGYYHD